MTEKRTPEGIARRKLQRAAKRKDPAFILRRKEEGRKYYLANKEKCKKLSRAWYLEHRQLVLDRTKVRQAKPENRPKIRASVARWRKNNPEKRAAYQAKLRDSGESKRYQRDWLASRPGYGAEKTKRYRERQKAKDPIGYSLKVKAMNAASDKENRRKLARKYHHEGMKNPVFVVVKRLRTRLHSEIRFRVRKCRKLTSVLNLIGCTREELVTWLESQFKPGMTWENRSEWHIDHKRPVSSFDMLDLEEQKKCFHYTNLQPLWAEENLAKHTKILQFPAAA